ncbi:MAG: hypothetical protein IJJ78_03035 [Paludibacteraceae bacterium]|nr:hypothetical protein [Paludibacteraceae bacterium]MBR0498040.1 hypothetical protein [Paludibacteraceae bacterium]
MKKLIYLLVSCMLFSLAACNDDKEDNGGSIIGLWKVTKFEGQVFGDEDISDPDEETYWDIKESGIDVYNYYKGKLDGDVEHATYEYDGKTLVIHNDGYSATCTIKSLTSSKMKMFIDYLIVQYNVEFERVDALPGEKSSSGSNSGVTYPVFKSGTENGHDYVDLGLTSGTKWATMNVGASNPQDYGNYYAWGETTTKETYDWSTYLDGRITDYSDCGTDKDALKGVTDIAGTQYDAAKANWGGKWRMPTKAQQDELRNQCYWVWTSSYNGSNVKGYIVYGAKNASDKGVKIYGGETPSSSYSLSDAHIFLPAAGFRSYGDLIGAGSYGYYWSSSLSTVNPYRAWYVLFLSDDVYYSYDGRYYGQSVRAVCK